MCHHYFPFVCFYITLFIWNGFSWFLSIWLVYASCASFLCVPTYIYQFISLQISCLCVQSHSANRFKCCGCLLALSNGTAADINGFGFFSTLAAVIVVVHDLKLDMCCVVFGAYESQLCQQKPDDPY